MEVTGGCPRAWDDSRCTTLRTVLVEALSDIVIGSRSGYVAFWRVGGCCEPTRRSDGVQPRFGVRNSWFRNSTRKVPPIKEHLAWRHCVSPRVGQKTTRWETIDGGRKKGRTCSALVLAMGNARGWATPRSHLPCDERTRQRRRNASPALPLRVTSTPVERPLSPSFSLSIVGTQQLYLPQSEQLHLELSLPSRAPPLTHAGVPGVWP